MVPGARLRTSWKNNGKNGEAMLKAMAAPVKTRRRVASGIDRGISSLDCLASLFDGG